MSQVYLRHSAKELRRLFDVLKDIVTDVNFQFLNGSIVIDAMDPVKISIIHVVLEKDAMEFYECTQDTTFGIFMPFLYKVVRSSSQADIMEFTIKSGHPDKMDIKVSNPETSTYHVTTVTSLKLPPEKIDIPVNYCENVVNMKTSELQKTIRELSHVSKDVLITLNPEVKTLVFHSSGPMGQCEIVINNPSIIYYNTANKEVQIKLYLKYIEKFCKPLLCQMVDMCIYDEYSPLVLSSRFTLGVMSLFIAPLPN